MKELTLKDAEFKYHTYLLRFLFMSLEDLIDMRYLEFEEWIKENKICII